MLTYIQTFIFNMMSFKYWYSWYAKYLFFVQNSRLFLLLYFCLPKVQLNLKLLKIASKRKRNLTHAFRNTSVRVCEACVYMYVFSTF